MKKIILFIALTLTFLANAQNFHDTQGKLEISGSGQSVYTLPIAMPPSMQDVGPVINLTYSSGQMGGMAGQGWNINSVSVISRVATRLDIDGYIDGVDFDDNDKLALDGQRLLLKTGNYWEDGSTYETEVQSNSKITLKGSGAGIYFIVTAPDGSETSYGQRYGGLCTDISAYYITRFVDTKKNFITYSYFQPFGKSVCIKEINFSGNELSNAGNLLNKIVFSYAIADRTENAYIKGIILEKEAILKKIEVFTNSLLFKRYEITHTSSNGFQRVSKLQEFNNLGEAANPILFEYKTTGIGATEIVTSYTDNFDLTLTPKLSGDFDGDGRLDFISDNIIYTKLFQGNLNTTAMPLNINKSFVGKTVHNNKYNQRQAIITPVETINNISFKIHSLSNTNTVELLYTKDIPYNNAALFYNHCPIDSLYTQPPTIKKSNEFVEGDFNGDGLSEVLVLSRDEGTNFGPEGWGSSGKPAPTIVCYDQYYTGSSINDVRLIDLNPSASNELNSPSNCSISNSFISANGQRFVMDFNSDGKDDILLINDDSSYKIIAFKQELVAPWVTVEILGQGTISYYERNKPFLFGDYNGDGKPDIMTPREGPLCANTPLCAIWEIYFSNPNPAGGSFFTSTSRSITNYNPKDPTSTDENQNFNQYIALDVDKDGKSDLVRYESSYYRPPNFLDWNDRDTSWKIHTYINNMNRGASGGFEYQYSSPTWHDDNSPTMPTILPVSYKFGVSNNDLLVFRYNDNTNFDKTITYVNFNKDVAAENYLSKVTQSAGALVDEITYEDMQPTTPTATDLGAPTDFYSSSDNVSFPFIELKKLPTSKLVSKLTNTVMGVARSQDFKYHGYVVQLGGLGVIGFKATARTAWYRSNRDKKTWNVNYIDPSMRGATKMTLTQLLAPGIPFQFNSVHPVGLLSKSENVFTQNTDPVSKRYQILLQKQTTIDALTNVVNEKIYNNYTPNYLLPTSITTNNYLGTTLQGSSTTVTTYNPPVLVGVNYNIGRPSEINTTISAYGDIKTSIEKIFYDGANISKIEKTPNNDAVTMVEEMEYFPNGNLMKKTMRATGTAAAAALAPRSTQYTYDSTERFVKTVTDTELMVTTNIAFDPVYGTVLEQQNPYLQITKSSIDGWGKPTKVTDFLGKSITYAYNRANGIFTTTETGDDGSCGMVESDALARAIRKGSKDINGNWNYKTTEYDYNGRKFKESEPYAATETASQFTTTVFDDYGRTLTITNPAGKVATASYSGLTVSSTDGIMTKSVTKDANGNQIATTDSPGGTITYKYDAAGNVLENNYDGIKTTITYDNWGRKTSMTDVSLGTYTYTYDSYGQLLTESNLKGTTTCTYTSVGKPLTKKVVGDGVNITSTYNYDATRKWLNSIIVDNTVDGNSTFTYSYDITGTNPTYQLNKTIESRTTTPPITFTKELTFDAFGRVLSEKSTALAEGKTANKVIFHEYKNGAHFRLRDASATGTILYQTNTENARGQLTSAQLGNGIAVGNTYDSFGFPTQIKHTKSGTTPLDIMTLNYNFNAQRGNLNERYNSMFNYKEKFEYDLNDRLTKTMSPGAQFLNLTFSTTTEGFIYFGGTPGAAVLNTQKLRVTAPRSFTGVKKQIITNNTAGRIIKIDADVVKISGNGTVNAMIREVDPFTLEQTESILGTVGTGASSFEYVTQLNANVVLSYEVADSSGLGIRIGAATLTTTTTTMLTGLGTPVQSAVFSIDNVKIANINIESQNYDARGRITDNSVGQYFYTDTTARPYQNTSVLMLPEAEAYYATRPVQEITYNAFKRPTQIKEQGIETLYFGYNAMEQRQVMYYGGTQTDKMQQPKRRYYSADGTMEVTYTLPVGATPTSVEILTYVGGDAYSAPIVWKSVNNATPSYFYLHRDNQSSILAITNEAGTVLEKRLFDPWGNVVAVQNGLGVALAKMTFFDRGYTGHEHLQGVGLINMNARLYDPKLHRFLQADDFVQDPNNTQNYNRYAYCYNNPLSSTDPSGNFIIAGSIFLTAIIIGATVGIAVSIGTSLYFGTPITAGGIIGAAIMGAVSGAITCGIGNWAQSAFAHVASRASFQALAHGAFQGTLSSIQGGSFLQGFAAGALSSIASSVFGGASGKESGFFKENNWAWGTKEVFHSGIGTATGTVGMIAFGSIMGGVGSSLTGGNFWQGAVTGAFVSGLNHAMHSIDPPGKKKSGFLTKGSLENSKSALDLGGGTFGALESTVTPDGMWLGKNGKYYSKTWGGNGTTGSRAGALKASENYKFAGRAVGVVSVGVGVVETINGYQMDGGNFGYNAQSAAASTTGSMLGGWAGAEAGAAIGAGVGVWFGGVGAVPGAIIGGFIGGLSGGYVGGAVGQGSVNYYHNKN